MAEKSGVGIRYDVPLIPKEFYPDVADRTLNRDIQALVDKGILKAQGEKKGRRYGI